MFFFCLLLSFTKLKFYACSTFKCIFNNAIYIYFQKLNKKTIEEVSYKIFMLKVATTKSTRLKAQPLFCMFVDVLFILNAIFVKYFMFHIYCFPLYSIFVVHLQFHSIVCYFLSSFSCYYGSFSARRLIQKKGGRRNFYSIIFIFI